MEKLEYIIEDKTIAEILGVQNFTNEESAILELVKNSYDAEATDFVITISKDRLVIDDNGIGMDRDKILHSWMHIGRSDKDYLVGSGADARVLSGSKGVGRFAIARLGAKVSVYTKMDGSDAILWETDWNASTLRPCKDLDKHGTKIVIEHLRDNWTAARVRNLKEFLSRTYDDNKMKIRVDYRGEQTYITRYFNEYRLGINCVSVIKLFYDARQQKLTCRINSDEFLDPVARFCLELDLHTYSCSLDMADELSSMRDDFSDEVTDEDWRAMLASVGSFRSEFYFSLKDPSTVDAERFFYKHRILSDRFAPGVILYRNAFSISSYEGKKDWLGFGKRSRLSPAAASHMTGSWRVRENQISGKVIIDKRENHSLSDLVNRQGLVENDAYKLFIAIIVSGINCFERYRQRIIRSIVKKNAPKEPEETNIIDELLSKLRTLSNLTTGEETVLLKELKTLKDTEKKVAHKAAEAENKYRYDVRLLNLLATSGLKAISISHEMYNKRNSISTNVDNIIAALKRYELWDIVTDPVHTGHIHRDIPALLEKNRKINERMASFMDTMLAKSEKEQFYPEDIDVFALLDEIRSTWLQEAPWIRISLDMDRSLCFRSAKDIFRVILDNLILNSVQQNDKMSSLDICLKVDLVSEKLHFMYSDNGNGLPDKYKNDRFRILEVHESSRPNGHGIGMWIVNNTVVNTGGEILEIGGGPGFSIEFTIGGRI